MAAWQSAGLASAPQSLQTPEVLLNLSVFYFQGGNPDRCIAAAKEALKLRPNYGFALVMNKLAKTLRVPYRYRMSDSNHMHLTFLVGVVASALALSAQPAALPGGSHEMLDSVLWVQTAIEHDASYEQAFRLARWTLDRARGDKRWTAAIEQVSGYERLPPAVVLDIDETILDNSPAEAEVIRRGGPFDAALWDDWIQQQRAASLPGALEFTRYAASKHVAVLYVTNRHVRGMEATRRTLARLGFPLQERVETIYFRSAKPEWGNDKSTRRAAIARQYRILLLIGDDLGDFLPGVRTSGEERRRIASPYRNRWGERWIILPNPMYGTWESALYGADSTVSAPEQLRRKFQSLRPMIDQGVH
ncbi:MAG TPA: HAD family acid phosphatase [Bryobacteraceae bacterium]